MSDISQAAEQVTALVQSHRALGEVAAVLERIGNLEHYEAELSARIEATKNAEADAIAQHTVAQSHLSDILDAATATSTEANAIAIQAALDADAIRAQATTDGVGIVTLAQSQADTITRQTEAQRTVLADVLVSVGIARGELSELQAKLAAVKQSVAAFIN